jgi:3-hydroxyacyl-[acyl-carrier-protein] dehydratase
MSLSMIDRIVGYEKGKRLSALKVLSRGEEYLADHFPSFPILPGVLMLEAMVQAGAWLMRLSEGFSPPVIVLREARAVRYGNVVKPGDELRVEVELVHGGGGEASFKGSGRTGDKNAVLGRFVLRRVPLARLGPGLAQTDETIARLLEERLPSLMECDRGL